MRAAGVDFSGFAFQGEPQLQIDECSLQIQAPAPDRLALRGWAIVRSGSVREVQVTLDGELLATAPVGAPRPDVAALFGERFLACGWECACALPPGASRSAAVLIVRVVDGRGTGQPLWAGSLEGALLASSRQLAAHLTRELAAAQGRLAAAEARVAAAEARAAHEAAELCARIAAMEASRFWKARNAWFRVKGRLGVG